MRVLVACECSGVIRDAFIARGYDAWSCDLQPSEGNHYQEDVRDVYNLDWDLMIAHPPCTHLAVCGALYFKEKEQEQEEALDFVCQLMAAPIDKICIENPISIISTRIRLPDQIIHPYMFGHEEAKSTCLWLTNLPKLIPTDNSYKGSNKWMMKMGPSPFRAQQRALTFKGIAEAMADQWGEI